jgi:hypothetical protein
LLAIGTNLRLTEDNFTLNSGVKREEYAECIVHAVAIHLLQNGWDVFVANWSKADDTL